MKKILILIFFLGMVGGGYYLWTNQEKIFFQGEMELKEGPAPNEDNSQPMPKVEINNEQPENQAPSTNTNIEISQQDCNQQCQNFEATDSFDYCKEICGLNQPKDSQKYDSEDCSKLSGYDKDVCLKNKAVKEKDDNYCNQINDAQLKESCINRVLEDLL